MPFNIGWMELVVILIVALIIFGPGKLPDVGKALGKSIREFKGAINKVDSDIKKEMDDIKSAVDLKDVTADINVNETKAETVHSASANESPDK